MACSGFQEDAAELSFRRISFCVVMNGLEGACKPTRVIRSADEGKYGGVQTLVRKRHSTEQPRE